MRKRDIMRGVFFWKAIEWQTEEIEWEREIKRGVRVFKRCNTIKESEIDIMVGRGYNEMEGK